MRQAARVDANQPAIVKALRAVGAKVQPLHMIGRGCPDALVAFRGCWYVAEIKDGSKPPSRWELTPDEKRWHERFGAAAKVNIWHSVDEALCEIGATGGNDE